MRHILRDRLRSLLVCLAAMTAGLGVTVHLFTRQQTRAVEESVVTLAVRHYPKESFFVRAGAVLEKLNGLDCVRVPALTKVYAGCASSAKPVYSGLVEGSYGNT